MSLPGWEGGGWVILNINPTFIYGQLDQLPIKSPNNDFFEKNRVMFRPHFDPFIGIWGIPDQYKNESLHKTDYCNVLSDI